MGKSISESASQCFEDSCRNWADSTHVSRWAADRLACVEENLQTGFFDRGLGICFDSSDRRDHDPNVCRSLARGAGSGGDHGSVELGISVTTLTKERFLGPALQTSRWVLPP